MRTTWILIGVAVVFAFSPIAARAGNSALCRAIGALQAAEEADPANERFVVHEWGTFTTFSGSDGVYLDFRPLASDHSDLPDFVLDRVSKSITSRFTKARIRGKVRMETPVTYFYTDRIRQVNVRVGFPQGLLTEFYPPVREMLPPLDEKAAFGAGEPIGESSLDWGKVTLIPSSHVLPGITDPKLREQVVGHLVRSAVPRGGNDAHYAAARATDSALVHVRGTAVPSFGANVPAQDFMEKFLFYRGVGRFQLPIRAVFDQQGRVTVRNDGQLPIDSAILVDVHSGMIRARMLEDIDANGQARFESLSEITLDNLSTLVKGMLVSQGLYKKEAESMVQTWNQSWFAEEGTRVLYIVPEPITDELLPLSIKPAPDETLRVLVGRMEIMSPQAEQRMILALRESQQARVKHTAMLTEGATKDPFPVSPQIQSFGRMTEPALVRVSKIAPESALRVEAERLIAQVRAR